MNLEFNIFLWFIIFIIATSGASSAHLTISEVFPIVLLKILVNKKLNDGNIFFNWIDFWRSYLSSIIWIYDF